MVKLGQRCATIVPASDRTHSEHNLKCLSTRESRSIAKNVAWHTIRPKSGARIAAGARGAGLAEEHIRETTDINQARQVLCELGGEKPGSVVLLKASRAIGLERLLG